MPLHTLNNDLWHHFLLTQHCCQRWASVSLNLFYSPHDVHTHAHTRTYLIPCWPLFCSVFSASPQISVNVLCQVASEWRPVAAAQGERRLRIGPASSTGLSFNSLPPLSSPSTLHQLIQAWSDTWASRVSAAIKTPPLQHFNWNFCCWCVNSCRTEKGRSIIPALRRPPQVKWQQFRWQENPQSSCLFMILLLHPSLCAVLLSHLHIRVWLWDEMESEGEGASGGGGWAGRVKWPARTYF